MNTLNKTFLPVTLDECHARGWDAPDFVYVCGDAYVDHPSFGLAIISRILEKAGYRVAMLCLPPWQDVSAFKQFGKPRLGFLVSAGVIDSMVNHYTVSKAHRKADAYTPGGVMGKRPDYAVTVYCNLIRRTYRRKPIIIGGIEASLRRLAHYDYWSDKLKRSILLDAQADLLLYGMGERSIVEVAEALNDGMDIHDVTYIDGTVFRVREPDPNLPCLRLPDYASLAADPRKYAESFYLQYCNTDPFSARRLLEPYGEHEFVVQNPPQKPLSQAEMDRIYALPYCRTYHPSYEKRGGVPAISEVRFSLASNRGCFGACSFCALTFHQGRIIQSRSPESILREGKLLTQLPNFKGYIHDVGGPTANFRKPACPNQLKVGACKHRQCLFPQPCKNLQVDHEEFLSILKQLRELPKVKKVFVRSGIRFDYLLADKKDTFFRELVQYHISGQLKVAPEHCVSSVLDYMGKPHFDVFLKFWRQYKKLNEQDGTEQYLVPYLMSSHPGCTLSDAVKLAEFLHKNGRTPEQVQDFYPTPGTVSTCMFYTGLDPYTLTPGTLSTCMYYTGIDPRDMSPVYVARDPKEKAMQRALLQWSRPEKRALVVEALEETGRTDLIGYGKECLLRPRKGEPYGQPPAKPEKPERPSRRPRKEAAGNRGRRGTPTARQPAQKGKMSPRKKAAFAKKRKS